MKRIFAFGMAPLMISVFAGPAPAQDGQRATGADVSGEVTAGTRGEDSFGTVISAIQTGGEAAADVETVTDAARVRVIRVSDFAQGDSMNALENALSRNAGQVEEFRAAISSNSTVSGKLEQERMTVEDVVAAIGEENGGLVIYVR